VIDLLEKCNDARSSLYREIEICISTLSIDPMSVEILNRTVQVQEVLAYLQADGYLSKRTASKYLGISVRNLEARIREIPHFRLGSKTLFKKSELDQWMERHRENPEAIDLQRLADEVVMEVLGRSK